MGDQMKLYEVYILSTPLLIAAGGLAARGGAIPSSSWRVVLGSFTYRIVVFIGCAAGLFHAFLGLAYGPSGWRTGIVLFAAMFVVSHFLGQVLEATPYAQFKKARVMGDNKKTQIGDDDRPAADSHM